jgi:hypothetical protein
MNAKRFVAGGSLLLAGFSLALTGTGRALANNAEHAMQVFVTGGTVGIDPSHNTVNVGNTPLPVTGSVALNDGAGAVTLSAQALANNGSGEATIVDEANFAPFTVPAGKRLVLDGIALFVSVPNGIHFNSVFIRRNRPTSQGLLTTYVQLSTSPVGDNPNFKFYGHMGPMRAYFEAGDTLTLGFTTSGPSTSNTADLTLYGRLVPAI